jgi:hypothetical protein
MPSDRFTPRSSSAVSLLKMDPRPASPSEAVGPAKSCLSASWRTPGDPLVRRGLGQTQSRGAPTLSPHSRNTWITGCDSVPREVVVVVVAEVVVELVPSLVVEVRSPADSEPMVQPAARPNSSEATSTRTPHSCPRRRPE